MNLLTSQEAATYLGFKEATLRNSRCTSKLANIPTPRYLKLGNTVRYKRVDLDNWLDSLNAYAVCQSEEA